MILFWLILVHLVLVGTAGALAVRRSPRCQFLLLEDVSIRQNRWYYRFRAGAGGAQMPLDFDPILEQRLLGSLAYRPPGLTELLQHMAGSVPRRARELALSLRAVLRLSRK